MSPNNRLRYILLVKQLILPAGGARKNRLFCTDTLILLELCSVPEKFSPLWDLCIFANMEGSLALTPKY